MISDPPSPVVSPTHPASTNNDSTLPIEACFPPQSPLTNNEMPTYEELQTSSPPTQAAQLLLTHQSPDEEQTQPFQTDLIPFGIDTSHKHVEYSNEHDSSDMINIHRQSEDHGELPPEEIRPDTNKDSCDFIMTGWQPVPPIAGQKRQRSPDPELMETRHGRRVKKHDYSLLHYGMAAHASSDPTTWE